MMLEQFLGKLGSYVVAPVFSEINSPSALKEDFVYLQGEYFKAQKWFITARF